MQLVVYTTDDALELVASQISLCPLRTLTSKLIDHPKVKFPLQTIEIARRTRKILEATNHKRSHYRA